MMGLYSLPYGRCFQVFGRLGLVPDRRTCLVVQRDDCGNFGEHGLYAVGAAQGPCSRWLRCGLWWPKTAIRFFFNFLKKKN